MHKQQRRHDVRLRGCPTCWLNLRLHGRTGLYAPHVCACVYSMNVSLSIVLLLRKESCGVSAEKLDFLRSVLSPL